MGNKYQTSSVAAEPSCRQSAASAMRPLHLVFFFRLNRAYLSDASVDRGSQLMSLFAVNFIFEAPHSATLVQQVHPCHLPPSPNGLVALLSNMAIIGRYQ